jgi:hypothetical protein
VRCSYQPPIGLSVVSCVGGGGGPGAVISRSTSGLVQYANASTNNSAVISSLIIVCVFITCYLFIFLNQLRP